MRMINVDDFISKISKSEKGLEAGCEYCKVDCFDCVLNSLYRQPVIDAEPVRHGAWLPVDELYDAFDCLECDAMVHKPCNYCPKCGAKMDLGDNNAKT